jgi:TolB-like protein/Tfp pilus assembly protein PilF
VLWPEGTFVDFEHSLNAVMNRLRSQLSDSAEEQHYIETLPGLGYRFLGLVEAIPSGNGDKPANQLLPANEVAPQPATASRPRADVKLWRAIGIVSTLAVLLILTLKFQTTHSSHSLVLLPFHNLANDPKQEFLADGITDALTTELGRSPDLRIISKTSADCYKHTAEPLTTIAKELRVNYLVEGSVTPFRDRVRVTVRLAQAQPDRYLWSKSYEIDLSGAPEREAEIAQTIASEISAKLTRNPSLLRTNTKLVSAEAYEAYLKGRYMLGKGTEDSIHRSSKYFEEAIARAPDYADAHAALAESYCALSTIYAAPSEVMPKARKEAERALQLDGNLSEAHAVRGRIATLYDWNWQVAERHLKKALDLNPSSASAHVAYFDFLVIRGRYDEALSEVKKSQALDPVSLSNSVELLLGLFDAGRFDALPVYAAKSLEIDPEFSWAHTLLGWIRAREGRFSEGLADLERGYRTGSSSEQSTLLAEAQLIAGDRKAAESRLSELVENRKKGYVCAHAVGALYSALGLKEEALKWLEIAYRERSDCMPFLRNDPETAALHSDPRFLALVRRVQGQ